MENNPEKHMAATSMGTEAFTAAEFADTENLYRTSSAESQKEYFGSALQVLILQGLIKRIGKKYKKDSRLVTREFSIGLMELAGYMTGDALKGMDKVLDIFSDATDPEVFYAAVLGLGREAQAEAHCNRFLNALIKKSKNKSGK